MALNKLHRLGNKREKYKLEQILRQDIDSHLMLRLRRRGGENPHEVVKRLPEKRLPERREKTRLHRAEAQIDPRSTIVENFKVF